MYPAKYASIDRVHTVEEALLYPTEKAKGADLFLFVLDTYDCLLSCVGGEIPCSPESCEKLRTKLYETLITRYDEIRDRIPGRLKGWTEATFLFVTAALAGTMGTSSSLVPPKVREWMKEQRLRVNDSYDVMEWTYTDLVSALEALESGRGDCTEHSILFVALARALGIPARVAVGIAYWPPGDGFGWHAWAEVKAGDDWYAVDPTWNQPIADATHLKLADGGPAEQASIVMLLGKLRIVNMKI